MSVSGSTPPPVDLPATLSAWSDRLGLARMLADAGRPVDARAEVDAAQREILRYSDGLRAARAEQQRSRVFTPTGAMGAMPTMRSREIDLMQDMSAAKLPPLREKTYRYATPPQAVAALLGLAAVVLAAWMWS